MEKYHQKRNSNSRFAIERNMIGCNITQREYDRIGNALFCTVCGTFYLRYDDFGIVFHTLEIYFLTYFF